MPKEARNPEGGCAYDKEAGELSSWEGVDVSLGVQPIGIVSGPIPATKGPAAAI